MLLSNSVLYVCLQESVTAFLTDWKMEGRGKGNEQCSFRTSGPGFVELVRPVLFITVLDMFWRRFVGALWFCLCFTVDPPDQKLRCGPTFTGEPFAPQTENNNLDK